MSNGNPVEVVGWGRSLREAGDFLEFARKHVVVFFIGESSPPHKKEAMQVVGGLTSSPN